MYTHFACDISFLLLWNWRLLNGVSLYKWPYYIPRRINKYMYNIAPIPSNRLTHFLYHCFSCSSLFLSETWWSCIEHIFGFGWIKWLWYCLYNIANFRFPFEGLSRLYTGSILVYSCYIDSCYIDWYTSTCMESTTKMKKFVTYVFIIFCFHIWHYLILGNIKCYHLLFRIT